MSVSLEGGSEAGRGHFALLRKHTHVKDLITTGRPSAQAHFSWKGGGAVVDGLVGHGLGNSSPTW